MNIFLRTVVTFASALVVSGCVGISMHSTRPVEVRLTEIPSGLPIRQTDLTVTYEYDSYGCFWLARTPPPSSAITDDDGRATILVADFRYSITLEAGKYRFSLSRALVRSGGTQAIQAAYVIPPYPSQLPGANLVLTPQAKRGEPSSR